MNTTEPTLQHRSGPPLSILGVPFDNVTTTQTLNAIAGMVASGKPHYIATANVDFTAQAMHDEELRRVLLDAHMVVCDGMPLVWASRWLGNPLPERVAGSDLVPKLLGVAEKKGWSVFFLGGEKEVAWRAVQNVRQKHPKLKIAGMMSPEFKPLHEMEHERICAEIRSAKPDLLFVSFGCPKQEKWIAMNYQRAGAPVTIGVGATIDFLAGHMRRAPRWMQRTGLEWAFRLAQEPKRLFKRYANDFAVFGGAIGKQWWLTHGGRETPPPTAEPVMCHETPELEISSVIELDMPERFDAAEVMLAESMWMNRLQGPQEGVVIDCSGAKFIDSTGLGMLMRVLKHCRETGRKLVLAGCSKAVADLLRMTRLHALFIHAENRGAALLRVLAEMRHDEPSVPAVFSKTPVRLAWSGDVTGGHVEGLWRGALGAMRNAADAGLPLEITLEGVSSVDAGGLGLMARLKKQARSQHVNLSFTCPSDAARTALSFAQLEDSLLAS